MKRFLHIVILFFCFNLVSAQQITYSVNTSKSVIAYKAQHPLHDWTGTNNNLLGLAVVNTANNQIDKLALVAKVSEFDSKNSNRDAHSLEVLEALSYPTVKFYATSIELNPKVSKVKGELTFHGITKEIELDVHSDSKQNYIELTGEFTLNLTTYEIEIPSLLGIAMDELISIQFEVILEPKI